LIYTPTTILASVILSALPGLIDLSEAYKIWKVDKIDFLACAGAFFGVLFASVEIGLLAAGTQRFLQRLELYASVVMGLEAPALVNGQNLAITYNVFLGNHTVLSNIKYFMLIKHININIHNILM
ncbi:probable sulfate transporter 3.4, partial [Glycine soja]|uniref:probable sulfate transporter 3.4 n=1 Tax=Glycine soja TaxID=3848 RepID=UPI00103D63D8